MKTLNKYINEAWNGVKQHSLKSDIKTWCEEMGIEKYTINSQGEIDVDGNVNLVGNDFKELPFKFGRVKGFFSTNGCKNLTSLKKCPNIVDQSFVCSHCPQLNYLEGCPKEVGENFWCMHCQRYFSKEEVKSLCNVCGKIINI